MFKVGQTELPISAALDWIASLVEVRQGEHPFDALLEWFLPCVGDELDIEGADAGGRMSRTDGSRTLDLPAAVYVLVSSSLEFHCSGDPFFARAREHSRRVILERGLRVPIAFAHIAAERTPKGWRVRRTG